MTPAGKNLARRSRAFSLVQTMVVIGILAVLIVMSLYGVSQVRKSTYSANTKSTIAILDTALDQYKSKLDEYPNVGGSFTATTPSALSASAGEITWTGKVLTKLQTVGDNATILANLDKGAKKTYSSVISDDLFNFRNATSAAQPLAIGDAQGRVTASALEGTRAGGTLTFILDGWGHNIVYVPSDASDDTAATLRPYFVSAGQDGILQSLPWTSTVTYMSGATVYYKQKWYICTYTSGSTNNEPGVSSHWAVTQCDDIMTRGDWR